MYGSDRMPYFVLNGNKNRKGERGNCETSFNKTAFFYKREIDFLGKTNGLVHFYFKVNIN